MTTDVTHDRPPRDRSIAARAAAVGAVVVGLGLGLWIIGAATPGYAMSIALSIAWFAVVGALVAVVARRRAWLRVPLRVTYLAVAALSAVGFYWTSIRDDRVDEAVVTGVAPVRAAVGGAPGQAAAPVNVNVATGTFAARAHPGRGTATVVRLANGGQVVTFTDFETDNGPDLRVYLTRGGSTDGAIDLGRLKGNVGNQQYELPAGTDVSVFSTVVIWCRAFSVSFAEADLRPF